MFGGYGRYGYGMLFDPTIGLVLIGVIISLWAQGRLTSTFNRSSRVRSMTGMTGAEAAKRLLNSQGIYDVTVRPVAGNLTDHYDPRTKTVNLSQSVFNSSSVAAIGVAAHECGHAIQDNESYVPLRLRTAIGILLFSLAVLFQLVTLPVEYNASARAVKLLDSQGILGGQEVDGTRKVLNAAALTYVAAAATSILQLLRLVILFGGRNDRD